VIRDTTLPFALGIVLYPIAIVVAILIAATVEGRKNGVAFTCGWVLG